MPSQKTTTPHQCSHTPKPQTFMCRITSGFCTCCGVDISRFSHEFWCRHANS
ncbi:hypothetical protein PHYBLDRAFT_157726 [Phycomyces blakesleeanus NRRL 1555(-)]|uniref:Uncharacterized protein n=1 Tax=Phycomyces blakesleeanus (strain ATCC 8743b / DSM 1359 / FGSC 10004 / NBRC 33097 / NRRL 1555) TaxID=763407 RepID=A0A162URF1_PHYB8|nr:hypothetical protein PHYBLDRAFT_157726 [Phycomyces blakesleeanus NRRL 1555(-)]OAD77313.1 hypothetical protein PHYBLDRAFT_157726 [Phycomyces blakesleeanus NRRL 1555(-)]|eukprot:XP_018295353.1 hypothetical protein PHYBLDRAFT_157726 [Phycomyces blakesleeanus NRRL 1555(-)]